MIKHFLQSATAGLMVAVLGLSLAVPVQAQEIASNNISSTILSSNGSNGLYKGVGNSTYGDLNTTDNSLQQAIVNVINFVLSLIGIIFLVLTIYAGFLWMTAGGNDDQVGKAKKLIINSIIGIIIIVAAYAFTNFVLSGLLKQLYT